MGVMNLTDVDCYTHAIQLGLFFFIAYIVPELYQAYIWEERPQNLVLIKAVQGLLSTAGLTTLLYGFGTSIVWNIERFKNSPKHCVQLSHPVSLPPLTFWIC